jgi:hypothetical protein
MNNKTRNIIRRFPDFYTREDASVFALFVGLFGRVLEDVETDLLAVMHSHWVDKANNEGSQGFDTAQKGDLDKIFTLYLESLGGTSQLKQVNRRTGADGLKDDALYRGRIKGLIKVLMRGASTLEGIKAIVAANLGIVEDESDTAEERALVRAARDKIRIVEFSPDSTAGTNYTLTLFEPFAVNNPNPTPITPQFRLNFRNDLPFSLRNVRLVNTTSGQAVIFTGMVQHGDVLALFADGSALLNGVTALVSGTVPAAASGSTLWQVEADAVISGETLPIGRFDISEFDADPAVWMFSTPALDLNLSLTRLTPGFFTVYIPWDIPGFTDKFEELADHPRTQIGYIVNKVKAAGVGTAIVYEKLFVEQHDSADHLTLTGERQPFAEDQELDEANFDIGSVQMPYPGGVDQELEDRFIASGVFDFTRFDSLNTFAH